MRSILKDLLQYLTYSEPIGEYVLTTWLRQEAIRWACIFGDKLCQRIANVRLKEHLEDPLNFKLSPEWREWTYCKGAMIANRDVLLKLEKLSHIDDYKMFNYISCVEKPRRAIDIFFNSSLKWNNYPTVFCYVIFVDYAVEHIDEITRIIKAYNAPASIKNKLLFISINHLFSEDTLVQVHKVYDRINMF
ncbi:uncharacterized protein LOC113561832 [Ooceraea biroi]|uniref:uncharacterized protein LOC113561832 n=1 Tax=Ooceraea biroi TaxID=2015173 RepID=UPI000F087FC1|nr:uncharacterized protein LOC113561832 [Ooceraea biroi]